MAWKAYLDSINPSTTPEASVTINVRFENGLGKTMINNYTLQAYNFPGIQTMKDLVLGEVDKLNKFDSAVSTMTSFVGKEIK
jgi:hypothetical protein